MNKQLNDNRFERFVSLVGEDAFQALQKKKILVIGLGGVGGYVVESLVRSGISDISIVDFDILDITNMNRQIIALESTIGKKKVDVFEERIHDINPFCTVSKYDIYLNQNNKEIVLDKEYDYIIDCCDSMDTKKMIIDYTIEKDIPLLSCMGTANKMDPFLLEIVDLRKTINDPVARILRKYIREKKRKKKIMVLSSREVPKKNGTKLSSNSFVPPVAGLCITSYVIKKLIHDEK